MVEKQHEDACGFPLAGSAVCDMCQQAPAWYSIGFVTEAGYGSLLTCPVCTDRFKEQRPAALVVPLLTEEELRAGQWDTGLPFEGVPVGRCSNGKP